MDYEYDPDMEDAYRQSLIKSFKKQVDNLLFNVIIVDAVFDKLKYFEEMWSYAKSKGFQVNLVNVGLKRLNSSNVLKESNSCLAAQVYVSEVQAEVAVCAKRNTHKRSLQEIQKVRVLQLVLGCSCQHMLCLIMSKFKSCHNKRSIEVTFEMYHYDPVLSLACRV